MRVDICVEKLKGHDTSGKLGKIEVEVGEEINNGDIAFYIESSKGSIKTKSKYNGKVVEIKKETGDIVKKGDVVIVIESEKNEVLNKNNDSKSKKGYSFGFAKPKEREINADVAIVGGGPGGYVAAIRASQLGKKVVLIEEHHLGGTCLNYGCIPTKALAHSAKILKHIKNADKYGFNIDSYEIEMGKVIDRKSEVVKNLVGGIEGLMEANEIEVIKGTAKVKSKSQLVVKTKKINATINFDKLIIATGSEVNYLNIEGKKLEKVITSKEALSLREIPKSITIIGGGVIGMEFAFIFNILGSEVHVIEYMPDILNNLDQDVIDVVKESAFEKGIKIHTGACASGIYETENDLVLTSYEIKDKTNYIATEKVMMAVGRKPRIDSLDLETLDVELNEKNNGIKVDNNMKTTNPNVYAIGDVTNIIQLAHVASHQGVVAAESISGLDSKMHYDIVPSAIFTFPEIGHVGITEKKAKEDKIDIKVSHFDFASNGKSVAMNSLKGFVKIITNPETNMVLGATIVGTNATDMIAIISNIISNKISLDEAIKVIYAHPTASESIHEAFLNALDRGLHNV